MTGRASHATLALLLFFVGNCGAPPPPARDQHSTPSTAAPAATAPAARTPPAPTRDLAIDESMGGHTLARHVGKSNAELAERLRREPRISTASTYTDRAIAERIVGAALSRGGGRLTSWERRAGPRPNLVLNYVDPARQPIGRSLRRG